MMLRLFRYRQRVQIKAVSRLRLAADDVLVLHVGEALDQDEVAYLTKQVRDTVDHNRVMILSGSSEMSLSVIEKVTA